ncbi:RusA family crossover junction endodeoxyribonuclease [Serinicoccus sp. LYQ131]|uniref:RusA family crossover junction endodeoxyribonuclease n=1 Tax=Serinicoccus sp. LYQ131 TaxID=3378797 RepID=UPI0038538219
MSQAATVAMTDRPPLTGRLAVRIDFFTARTPEKHPGWDLDNLIKPTIDALSPVIGARPGKWAHVQPDDERVDEIHARKRPVRQEESAGAHITVSVLPV